MGPGGGGGFFSQRLLSKCAVNTQFVANIVLTDESRFTGGGIVNFNNSHAWVDDNPHDTVTSRRPH
jgi:hypothetical protein